MDPYSGQTYTNDEVAEMFKRDPDKAKKLVYVQGDPESVEAMSEALKAYRSIPEKAKRRARNKAARASRKRNR